MSAATKTPVVRDRLTLRDSTDLLVSLDRWIEDHVDALELNGGALPDDLAQLLDEIVAAREERAEAIVWKLDEFGAYATSAKATKDRAARRQKVWENAIAALKAYAVREIERGGGAKIKAASATLRLQTNSAPTLDLRFDQEQMLAFVDAGTHPLTEYFVVARVVSIDKKALGAAYEARRAELEADAVASIDESDVFAEIGTQEPYDPPLTDEILAAEVEKLRRVFVDGYLASEFPGVSCVRGVHLRID